MPKKPPAPRQTPTHLKDLVADPTNRRKHNPRNIGMVVDALHKVGAARSIVIDEDNVVLAGNGVAEAAAEAGITKVRVIDADGDELIAVRRTGLSADQKRDLAMYDNRTGELSEWDTDQLLADVASGLSMESFFTDNEKLTLGFVDPQFMPVDEGHQNRLDVKTPIVCPQCKHAFVP